MDPSGLRDRYDEEFARLRARVELPRMRAEIGDASVDLLTEDLIVPILNGFNWQPRPVFQSHVAFTAGLLRLNAEYYQRADAPEFVILKLDAIDARLPLASDALALRTIRRTHTPVLVESDMLLLRRRDSPLPQRTGTASSGAIRFGEWTPVEAAKSEEVRLDLVIETSLWGRLQALVYRLPILRLDVEVASGARRSYRILPDASREGFLLSPLITGQRDLLAWYAGRELNGVRRVRVRVEPESQSYCFSPEFVARWLRLDPVLGVYLEEGAEEGEE